MGISSVGIGSSVLTSDVLDKLKAADKSAIITPLENKIKLANQKSDANKLLNSLMDTLKSSASSLNDENLYLGRTVDGNSDAVTVTAQNGSDISDFSISNVSIAKKDVWSSDAVDDTTAALDDLGSGTLSLDIDNSTFKIDYTDADTLESVRDKINEEAGDKVTASILQVGDSSYKLSITSDATNQAITYSDSNDDDSLKSVLNLDNIQPAKAATFDYNGISITRSNNEISDLVNGATITLNKDQAEDESANINISQNTSGVTNQLSLFVTNYNTLMTNIDDMTGFNKETGGVGIFNGESFINSIQTDISAILTHPDASSGDSLVNYGINIDKHGVMSLDSTTLNKKLADDPTAAEKLLRGDGTDDGVFTKLDKKMNDYMGFNKLMSNFSGQLNTERENLIEEDSYQTKILDSKYDILKAKFIAYDTMISKINTQFASLQSMIDAQSTSN